MVKVITPPSAEPVNLDDFKTWMQGLPISEEQGPMVNSLLKAGREEAEAYQNVAYCEQTLQIAPEPDEAHCIPSVIVLSRPPFRELKSVVINLADGTARDITETCTVDDTQRPAELYLSYSVNAFGPLREVNPLVITYAAGYDTVPEKVRQAILLYATWAWMHRGGDEPIPEAFYALLSKGRVVLV